MVRCAWRGCNRPFVVCELCEADQKYCSDDCKRAARQDQVRRAKQLWLLPQGMSAAPERSGHSVIFRAVQRARSEFAPSKPSSEAQDRIQDAMREVEISPGVFEQRATRTADLIYRREAGTWIQNRAFEIIQDHVQRHPNSPLRGISNNPRGNGADYQVQTNNSSGGVAFEVFAGSHTTTSQHSSSHTAVGSGTPTALIPYTPVEPLATQVNQ